MLGADGAPLVDGAEGCELAMGLVESPGLPDVGEPDGGDARLLPGIDVGEMLGADGTSLLGGGQTPDRHLLQVE